MGRENPGRHRTQFDRGRQRLKSHIHHEAKPSPSDATASSRFSRRDINAHPCRGRQLATIVMALGFLAGSGCSHLGPTTVAVDRFDYAAAIGDSWKQQTLLNIV